jgi:hypothetical protein
MTIRVEKKATTLEEGINNLIEAMVLDYNNFCNVPEMREKYKNSFVVKNNRKYIKIMSGNAVKAFIRKEKTDPYGLTQGKEGDLFKPASWKVPAKHSRGNIFEGNYPIQWTGPIYLKGGM